MNIAKTGNQVARGGVGGIFGGSGGKSAMLSAASAFAGFAATRGMDKVSNYYEAIGNHDAAKRWKIASFSTSSIAKGATTGASIGGMVGTAVEPGGGTAVGAVIGGGVGAGLGVLSAAFEYLTDRAKEAGDALAAIPQLREKLRDIVDINKQRNDMRVASGNNIDARDKLYKDNNDRLAAAEKESNRLAELAEFKGIRLDDLKGNDVDWKKFGNEAKDIIEEYQKQQKIMQRSQQIIEAVDRAREKEAKAKELEAAKQQQLKNW